MSADRDQWLKEALATRDLDRLQPNMAAAGDRVNDARRHIRSARLLAVDDPTLAIAACHDAIRKALTAHAGSARISPASRSRLRRLHRGGCRGSAELVAIPLSAGAGVGT